MVTLLAIFFFLFGCAIGSFLNVVILRYNTGLGMNGRSQCFSCGKKLQWYELIPILSFIVLRGKCSRCKSTISWQYPAVELVTGIVFLGLFIEYWPVIFFSFAAFITSYLFGVIIFSLLIVICVYDLRHKIIPDGLVFTLGFLTLLKLFIMTTPFIAFQIPDVMTLLAGPILALPFALLWLVSEGRWMGLGDAKLALSFGWGLGLMLGLSALIIAFWVGAVVGGILLYFQRARLTMKSEIPFAPFLIIGFSIVYFFGLNVLDLSHLIQ